jgi:hypothetical protein
MHRLLRASRMFIRDGPGAIGPCDVCGRLLGFIEAHIPPWDCLEIGQCAKYMRNRPRSMAPKRSRPGRTIL